MMMLITIKMMIVMVSLNMRILMLDREINDNYKPWK